MKRRVCFVEPAFHCEVLFALCRISVAAGYEVTVVTHHAVIGEAREGFHGFGEVNWVVFQKKTEGSPLFEETIRPAIRESDLVVLLTAVRSFRFWAEFDFGRPLLLMVHNGNAWFQPGSSLWMSRHFDRSFFPDILRLIRSGIRRDAHYRRRLAERAAGIGVLNGEISAILQQWEWPGDKKIIRVLPSAVFEGGGSGKRRDEVVITIPGAVTANGRDYDLVFEALAAVSGAFLMPVRLVLLGPVKERRAKKVVRKIRSLAGGRLRVTTFREYIPQAQFDAYLRQTDFFILPFKEDRKFDVYREKIGYTTISGAVNDMIRFGIPGLIARHYPLEGDLMTITEPFSDHRELADRLLDWANEKIYDQKRVSWREWEERYGEKAMAAKLKGIFDDLSG